MNVGVQSHRVFTLLFTPHRVFTLLFTTECNGYFNVQRVCLSFTLDFHFTSYPRDRMFKTALACIRKQNGRHDHTQCWLQFLLSHLQLDVLFCRMDALSTEPHLPPLILLKCIKSNVSSLKYFIVRWWGKCCAPSTIFQMMSLKQSLNVWLPVIQNTSAYCTF